MNYITGMSSEDFESLIEDCYDATRNCHEGLVASYIPQLAHVNPDLYGISFCDIHGRIFSIGDSTESFCLQSCVNPMTYCIARELEKEQDASVVASYDADDYDARQRSRHTTSASKSSYRTSTRVHDHVGFEPSGRAFNEFVLNSNGLPHNPLINAGKSVAAMRCEYIV
jgi:glutaminase